MLGAKKKLEKEIAKLREEKKSENFNLCYLERRRKTIEKEIGQAQFHLEHVQRLNRAAIAQSNITSQRTVQPPQHVKQIKKTPVMRTTFVRDNNSEKLNLSSHTVRGRMEKTMKLLTSIHCTEMEEDKERSVKDVLWYSFVKKTNSAEKEKYISQSKSASNAAIAVTARKHKPSITHRLVRSLSMLYKGGMISKRKYSEVRKNEKEAVETELLPYDVVIRKIKEEMQSKLPCFRIPAIGGCRRDLEQLLLNLAEIYLDAERLNPGMLDWFGTDGLFRIAIGGDGAPFGKHSTATAVLASVINAKHFISSRDHNYLIAGGNTAEDSPEMIEVTRDIFAEMEKIESKSYKVQGKDVSFSCFLVPADQKWAAKVSGELNNAATYPSSYGNVRKDDLGRIGGEFGKTWKKWDFNERLQVVNGVECLKKKTTTRTKITEYIAKQNSRQEYYPVIGKYVDYIYVEPLHCLNLAWQHWQEKLLQLVKQCTPDSELKKKLSDMDQDCSMSKYIVSIKDAKINKLHFNLCRKLSDKADVTNSVRLTGDDSKKLARSFPDVIQVQLTNDHIHDFKFFVLAYIGIQLRNASSIFLRTDIVQTDIELLAEYCRLYFNAHALFDIVNLTSWTIAHVIPAHTQDLYDKLGCGLGINSMQGREAKHTALKEYLEHTAGVSHEKRWEIAFRHEYASLFWLPKLKNQYVENVRKDRNKIITEFNSDTNCTQCGLRYQNQEFSCMLCSNPTMEEIKLSCKQSKITMNMHKLMSKS